MGQRRPGTYLLGNGRPVGTRTPDLHRVNLVAARLPSVTEADQVYNFQGDGRTCVYRVAAGLTGEIGVVERFPC
jgi:hypothetical protein